MNTSYPYECLTSIDSTNNYIKNRPEIWSRNFYTVRAIEQTNGRGRYGRSWFSGKNNLTFSFLYNSGLPLNISAITISAGLALRKALSRISGQNLLLKWPNDVTFKGKKLAGLLSEMIQGPESNVIIFGIGVNFNLDNIPEDLRDKTTCLKDITGNYFDAESVIQEIICEMQKYLPLYTLPLSADLIREFSEHCAQDANQVSVIQNGIVLKKEFTVTGINDQGLLCVIHENGMRESINAHELNFS